MIAAYLPRPTSLSDIQRVRRLYECPWSPDLARATGLWGCRAPEPSQIARLFIKAIELWDSCQIRQECKHGTYHCSEVEHRMGLHALHVHDNILVWLPSWNKIGCCTVSSLYRLQKLNTTCASLSAIPSKRTPIKRQAYWSTYAHIVVMYHTFHRVA